MKNMKRIIALLLAAGNQENNVHNDKEYIFIAGYIQQQVGCRLGDALGRAAVREQGCRRNDQQVIATASSIAIVIPPSIAFIVYSSICGASVGDLFMAGVIPGILMGGALIVVVMIEVR